MKSEILNNEREARKKLVESVIEVNGETWLVKNSILDMGEPSALFDGDVFTLIRGLEANPFILEITFEEPKMITGLRADFANMDFTITAYLYPSESTQAVEYVQTWRGIDGDPHVEMSFSDSLPAVEKVRLEIHSYSHGIGAHIHIRELVLLEN
jgi:hypothetical protein